MTPRVTVADPRTQHATAPASSEAGAVLFSWFMPQPAAVSIFDERSQARVGELDHPEGVKSRVVV
ncbi:hypothetical protein ACH46_04365 [Gordonia phthalatica]|uniref:Uncharacterized protein n=1 Tax=Gordonia phthalatica TaxID=1136941 RepID=A0A0N7FUB4_9ACTN|nr:hypothetical protein ACH46_04365 [Gordonia phthalatica]